MALTIEATRGDPATGNHMLTQHGSINGDHVQREHNRYLCLSARGAVARGQPGHTEALALPTKRHPDHAGIQVPTTDAARMAEYKANVKSVLDR